MAGSGVRTPTVTAPGVAGLVAVGLGCVGKLVFAAMLGWMVAACGGPEEPSDEKAEEIETAQTAGGDTVEDDLDDEADGDSTFPGEDAAEDVGDEAADTVQGVPDDVGE